MSTYERDRSARKSTEEATKRRKASNHQASTAPTAEDIQEALTTEDINDEAPPEPPIKPDRYKFFEDGEEITRKHNDVLTTYKPTQEYGVPHNTAPDEGPDQRATPFLSTAPAVRYDGLQKMLWFNRSVEHYQDLISDRMLTNTVNSLKKKSDVNSVSRFNFAKNEITRRKDEDIQFRQKVSKYNRKMSEYCARIHQKRLQNEQALRSRIEKLTQEKNDSVKDADMAQKILQDHQKL